MRNSPLAQNCFPFLLFLSLRTVLYRTYKNCDVIALFSCYDSARFFGILENVGATRYFFLIYTHTLSTEACASTGSVGEYRLLLEALHTLYKVVRVALRNTFFVVRFYGRVDHSFCCTLKTRILCFGVLSGTVVPNGCTNGWRITLFYKWLEMADEDCRIATTYSSIIVRLFRCGKGGWNSYPT